MNESLVNRIVAGGYRKVLVVDKSHDFTYDTLGLLSGLFEEKGFSTLVSTSLEDGIFDKIGVPSVIGMFSKKVEVVIVYVDTSACATLKIPSPFHVASKKILVMIINTKFKKQPIPKKFFDYTEIVNDLSGNVHIEMANSLVDSPDKIDSIDIHDMNMVILILHQNLLQTKSQILLGTYRMIVAAECFATSDDSFVSSYLQTLALLSAYKHGSHVKKMEYTQHLSKYSVQCANKKKGIALKQLADTHWQNSAPFQADKNHTPPRPY
jgi:hypothetical protein